MYGLINVTGGGSGVDINGVIKEYQVAAGQNINAGDFVEFVNENFYGTIKMGSTTYSGGAFSIEELSNERIFIAYTGTNNRHLYARVISIANGTFQLGTEIVLDSSCYTYGAQQIDTIVVSDSKVAVAYRYSASHMYVVICSINNLTVSKGNNLDLENGSSSFNVGMAIGITKFSSTSVLVTYSWTYSAPSYNIIGRVIKISNTTATLKNTAALGLNNSNAQGAVDSLSLIALNNANNDAFLGFVSSTGKLCAALPYEVTTAQYGFAWGNCAIVNTTTATYKGTSITRLGNGNVFMAYSYGSNGYLYGIIVDWDSDSTISKGTTLALDTSQTKISEHLDTVYTADGKVAIASLDFGNKKTILTKCSYSGLTITKDSSLTLDTAINAVNDGVSICTLGNKTIVGYSKETNSYLHLYVSNEQNNSGSGGKVKTVTTSSAEIKGVAIESGSSEQTIKVKQPV